MQQLGLSAFCLTTADRSVFPNMAGAAYGFAGMGPYRGGQADLLRVPYGDYNCLKLPPDAEAKQNDYVGRHFSHRLALHRAGRTLPRRVDSHL